MKNEVNRALVAKKKHVLTILFAALLPVGLMAQITEPGATEPNQLYTTTYDNPTGPNHAPGGPNRAPGDDFGGNSGSDAGSKDVNNFPVGTPWVLLGFAAAYGALRLKRRVEE